jgi:DME family drug/metabolite transporter
VNKSSGTVSATGWLLVVIAAMTWGLDIVFRSPLTKAGVDPGLIVFGEHLVLTITFMPVLIKNFVHFRRLTGRQWCALLYVAWGASAVATWLYTMAFVYGPPLSAILLQKTQPLFALALAPVVLGEKRHRFFWPLAGVAVFGAYLLALGWVSPIKALHGSGLTSATLALIASFLWGVGTVAGRGLSKVLPPTTLAAGRFALALPLLGAWLLIHPSSTETMRFASPKLFLDWLAMAAIPGIAGMTIYYYGIKTTPASIATLAELAYPATALIAGYLLLNQRLNSVQIFGLLVLIVAIQQIASRKTVETDTHPETVYVTVT